MNILRNRTGTLCRAIGLVAALALVAGAQVISDPVRSVDDIPPAPATGIQALNTGSEVLVTWERSGDDIVSYTPFGEGFVPTGGVNGYNIYRTAHGDAEALVGSTGAGVTEFADEGALLGVTYVYTVRAFDADNETDPVIEPGSSEDIARIVAIGGAPDVVVVEKVQGSMSFDTTINLEDQEAVDTFVSDFIALLAELLGIDSDRITVTSVAAGSVIVGFEIAQAPTGSGELSSADAFDQLLVLVADDTEDEFASIAPVLGIADESTSETVIVPTPIDPVGNVVFGWFSRQGSQVGFDDFLLFVDYFGTREGDANFDIAFDIAPNGKVDFDDFFRFADDFGKIIANADDIQAARSN